jgi:hypothetical protein
MLPVISLMTIGIFALDVAIPLGHIAWSLYLLPRWQVQIVDFVDAQKTVLRFALFIYQ